MNKYLDIKISNEVKYNQWQFCAKKQDLILKVWLVRASQLQVES